MARRLVGILVLVLGCVAATSALADEGHQLAGSWRMTVAAEVPPLGSFESLITFTRNGEVIESRRLYVPITPIGPILETTGHGAWERVGHREFIAVFTFLIQQAPPSAGAPLGTDNVGLRIRLDRSGEAFSGTFTSQPKDPNGDIIITVTGTIEGRRIRPCVVDGVLGPC